MQRILFKSSKSSDDLVSDVVRDTMRAVINAKTASDLAKVYRSFVSLASSSKYSTQQLLQAGAGLACLRALKLNHQPENTLAIFAYLIESPNRVEVFNLPGFRDTVPSYAMSGSKQALNIMWNMSDCEALA